MLILSFSQYINGGVQGKAGKLEKTWSNWSLQQKTVKLPNDNKEGGGWKGRTTNYRIAKKEIEFAK